MATEAEQAQVTKRYMVTIGMTSQSQILRVNMHWLMICSSVTCASRNATITSLQAGQGIPCVISKGPVTDVMVIPREQVALQPSAGKRHVDRYAVPNQALNHCPYLSKSVDMSRSQLTGSKDSLSGITGRNGDALLLCIRSFNPMPEAL